MNPTLDFNYQIRPATIDDRDVVIDFNCRLAAETEDTQLNREVVAEGVAALLSNPEKGRYFVMDVDGRIAGQVMHTWEWSDWRNGYFWWLQSVYVDHPFRRKGVFRALYQHMQDLAQADGGVVGMRLYIENDNNRACSTYEDMGMHKAGYFVMETDWQAKSAN